MLTRAGRELELRAATRAQATRDPTTDLITCNVASRTFTLLQNDDEVVILKDLVLVEKVQDDVRSWTLCADRVAALVSVLYALSDSPGGGVHVQLGAQ